MLAVPMIIPTEFLCVITQRTENLFFFGLEVPKVCFVVHVHLRRDLLGEIQLSGPEVLHDLSSPAFSCLTTAVVIFCKTFH